MKKLIFTFLFMILCSIINGQEKKTNLFDPWYVNYPLAKFKTDPEVSESYRILGEQYRAARQQQQINKSKAGDKKTVEYSLYDKTGHAKAYLTSNFIVYLWNGSPVAYFSKVHNGEIWHIYNFDGKHIGWTHSGVCFDNNGYIVCGLRDRIKIATYAERAKPARKSDKKARRYKGAKKSTPARPVFKHNWSSISLEEFFHY